MRGSALAEGEQAVQVLITVKAHIISFDPEAAEYDRHSMLPPRMLAYTVV